MEEIIFLDGFIYALQYYETDGMRQMALLN